MVELRANTRNFLPALYVTSMISLAIARSSRFRISSFPATISNFSAVKMIILALFRLQQNLAPRFLFFLINMKKGKGKLEARRIEESRNERSRSKYNAMVAEKTDERMLDAGLQRVLVYTGGRAHNVAVLSAEVLRNENSVGCHRPEITLSWCWATTTLGKGIVRSPCRSVSTSLLS